MFDDCPRNAFSVGSTLYSNVHAVSALDTRAHDFDKPVACHLDPASIHVDGLRRVGGVDISYRVDSGDGEAIAALVVLEFPSMKVNLPLARL